MAFASKPGQPPAGRAAPTRGFSVNTADRDEVVTFWHAVYQASEGYEYRVQWTGKYPDVPGSTSAAFVGDVERRINYFRAMAGVPANARVNTGSSVVIQRKDPFKPAANLTKSQASQSAAMMIIASYDSAKGKLPGMTHDPPPDLPVWNHGAWNAAANGNLAFGTYGPGAVTEYMLEELRSTALTSFWNDAAGHRRWLLDPESTDFATGDYPGEGWRRPPSNVLYVINSAAEMKKQRGASFVSYPSKGFFPAPLNSRFWSLSHKGADFSAASVDVTDAAGRPVPVSSLRWDETYGGPGLVWEVAGAAAEHRVIADRRFHVTVKGIKGKGVPAQHKYEVTFINPDAIRRGSPITGAPKARAGARVNLKINRVKGAGKSHITQYQRLARPWTEGGEGAHPDVVDKTSPVYPLVATNAAIPIMGAISGNKSFNLTFPDIYDAIQRQIPDQIMEIGPWVHTKQGSSLEFRYWRGLMSGSTSLAVEVSTDSGVTWKPIGNPITGPPTPVYDMQTFTASYQLPASARPMRVRLRYFHAVKGTALTAYLAQPGVATGIYLDDLSLVRCERLVLRKTRMTNKNAFRFQVPRNAKPGQRWAFGLETEFGASRLQSGPFHSLRIVR